MMKHACDIENIESTLSVPSGTLEAYKFLTKGDGRLGL